MTPAELRAAFLLDPDGYRRAIISGQARSVLAMFSPTCTRITSRQVANARGCHIEAAARLLRDLALRGYLKRYDEPRPDGGREYFYERNP